MDAKPEPNELTDLLRFMSLETAHIYKVVYETVVTDSGRLADAVSKIRTKRDASAVSRIITGLNNVRTSRDGTKIPVLVQAGGRGKWHSTALGDKLYRHVLALDRISNSIQSDYSAAVQMPTIRIGINSFSYGLLKNIETRVNKLYPRFQFVKDVQSYRSKDIISKLVDDRRIDMGIAESVLPITDRRVESTKIVSQKLHYVTNRKVPPEAKRDARRPHFKYLQESGNINNAMQQLPLPEVDINYIKGKTLNLADTRSFFEMLFSFGDEYYEQADLSHFTDENLLENAKKYFRIGAIFNSPYVLIDSLLYESNDAGVIATKEVCELIYQRAVSREDTNDVYFYGVDTELSVNKYLLFEQDAPWQDRELRKMFQSAVRDFSTSNATELFAEDSYFDKKSSGVG